MASPPCGISARPELDVKSQFMTREGLYKMMALSEYTRPNRVGYAAPGGGGMGGVGGGATAGAGGSNTNPPVRVSFARGDGSVNRLDNGKKTF